jgi:hypothetical protein
MVPNIENSTKTLIIMNIKYTERLGIGDSDSHDSLSSELTFSCLLSQMNHKTGKIIPKTRYDSIERRSIMNIPT